MRKWKDIEYPTWMKDFKVHECVGHRNGIGGVGFFAIRFQYTEDKVPRQAIATVSYEDLAMEVRKTKDENLRYNPDTRVIMLEKKFGALPDLEETMRGDLFHDALVKWLFENDKWD